MSPNPHQWQPDPGADLAVALERARVVGVLDAWAAKNDDTRVAGPFQAETPDAARAAAAKAIEAGEV